MKLSKSWIIAAKDLKIFRKKKSIVYTIAFFEIFISVAMPLIIRYAEFRKGRVPASSLPNLLDAFSYWFVIGAVILPMSLASYSFIGEKVQKSLEPLLATPTTDGEILMGKGIAALIPTIIPSYLGALVFMFLMDLFTRDRLGYYYPNWHIGVILLLLVPLASLLSISSNILISSRSNDIRSAQQMGALIAVPLGAVYVLSEIGVISLSVTNLLIMAAVLFVADLVISYLVRATFQREEILTKWK